MIFILDQMIEKSKKMQGFSQLPVSTQIALLLPEIEEARRLRIPLKFIQSALAEAGSKVTLRYFREALSIARSRTRTIKTLKPSLPTTHEEALNHQELTPKQKRDAKAESYMNQSHPLLNAFTKGHNA